MHVQVWHFLNAVNSSVGNHAKAVISVTQAHAGHLADLTYGAGIIDNLLRTGVLRKIIKADIGPFRDHQHMDRRLGRNVFESEAMLGFQNGFVGDFTAQDLCENVLIIVAVRHGFSVASVAVAQL